MRPQRPFFPGWAAWQYPVHVLIDLGASRPVTRLFLYNESGDNDLLLARAAVRLEAAAPSRSAATGSGAKSPSMSRRAICA